MARDLVVRYVGDTKPLEASTPVVQRQMSSAALAAEKMARRFETSANRAGAAGGGIGQRLVTGVLKASARIGQSSMFNRFQVNAAKAGDVAGKRVASGIESRASRIRWEALKSPKVAVVAVGLGVLFGRRFAKSAETSAKPDGLVKRFAGSLKLGAVGVAAAGAGLGIGLVRGLTGFIDKAGQAEQSIGAVEATFKRYSESIQAEAGRAAGAVGISANAYRELASQVGSSLKNKGIKDYAGQTRMLITLGGDLAAQYGGSTKDAVEALGSVLRGETDPIERYGVSLNQASIQAEAFATGIAKPNKNLALIKAAQDRATVAQLKYNEATKKYGKESAEALTASARLGSAQGVLEKALKGTNPQLTDQQKALAALSLLQKQTADSQGAFSRENDTYAHKVQVASARFEDLTTAIGGKFLPIATQVMGFIADTAVPTVSKWVGETGDMGPVVQQLGGLLKGLGRVTGTVFGPAAAAYVGGYKQNLTSLLDYVTTHQEGLVSGFVAGGNAVLDLGDSMVQAGVTGLQGVAALSSGVADFVQNGSQLIGSLIHQAALVAPLMGAAGAPLIKADRDFSAFQATADRTAEGLRGAGKGAADAGALLDSTLTPALDRTRTRLNEVGKQEIFKAQQRDAAARLAISIRDVGTDADGSQIKLKSWVDVSRLGEKTQAGLRRRLLGSQAALEGQLAAQQAAGAGQKDLTATWKTGRDTLYAEFVQMGLSKKEAGSLADKYAGIPPKVKTNVSQPGMSSAIFDTRQLRDEINGLRSKSVKINYSTNAAKLVKATSLNLGYDIGGPKGGRARGGIVSRGLKRGGQVPGRTPLSRGDDYLVPTIWGGQQPLRGGEGVQITEAMDRFEQSRLQAMNAGVLSGKSPAAVRAELGDGLATGGTVRRRLRTSVDTHGLSTPNFSGLGDALAQGIGKQVSAKVATGVQKALDKAGASAGNIDVNNPTGRTSYKGGTFTNLFAANLRRAEKLAGSGLNVYQGGFRPTTSYSGTSHAKDAVDISVNYALGRALRRVGIASGDRTGLGKWAPHIHAVPTKGAGYAGGSAVYQAQDYLRRGGPKQSMKSPWGLAYGGIVQPGPRVLLRDRGGVLPPGPSLVHNNTGRNEEVLTADERAALFSGAGARPVVVEVVADRTGMRALVRAEIREQLRSAAA